KFGIFFGKVRLRINRRICNRRCCCQIDHFKPVLRFGGNNNMAVTLGQGGRLEHLSCLVLLCSDYLPKGSERIKHRNLLQLLSPEPRDQKSSRDLGGRREYSSPSLSALDEFYDTYQSSQQCFLKFRLVYG